MEQDYTYQPQVQNVRDTIGILQKLQQSGSQPNFTTTNQPQYPQQQQQQQQSIQPRISLGNNPIYIQNPNYEQENNSPYFGGVANQQPLQQVQTQKQQVPMYQQPYIQQDNISPSNKYQNYTDRYYVPAQKQQNSRNDQRPQYNQSNVAMQNYITKANNESARRYNTLNSSIDDVDLPPGYVILGTKIIKHENNPNYTKKPVSSKKPSEIQRVQYQEPSYNQNVYVQQQPLQQYQTVQPARTSVIQQQPYKKQQSLDIDYQPQQPQKVYIQSNKQPVQLEQEQVIIKQGPPALSPNSSFAIPQPPSTIDRYKKIIQNCTQNNSIYQDSEFPPTQNSIGANFQNIEWLRPQQIFKGQKFDIFPEQIDPCSFICGELSDHYFIAALAAISEINKLVKSLFLTRQLNQCGCYSIAFIWYGIITEVLVDDRFPCRNGVPIFARSTQGNYIWIMLLEKAWAKLHGSYVQIDGGLVREAIHDLIGAPTKTYFVNGYDKQVIEDLWIKLRQSTLNQNIMTCGCYATYNSQFRDSLEKDFGLNSYFPYTIINAQEILDDPITKKYCRILLLKTPFRDCGGIQLSKDPLFDKFSDNVKKQLNYATRDKLKGAFYIDYQDFLRFFSDIQICYRIEKGVYSSAWLATQKGQERLIKVIVRQQGLYYFQVSQKTIRVESVKVQEQFNEKQYYVNVQLVMCKENIDVPVLVLQGRQRDLVSQKYLDLPTILSPGNYYIYINFDWQEKTGFMGISGIGSYGSAAIEFQEITKQPRTQQIQKFISQVNDLYNQKKQIWENI